MGDSGNPQEPGCRQPVVEPNTRGVVQMEQGDLLGSEQADAARNRCEECSHLSGAAQSPHNGALAHALTLPDQGANPDLSETLDKPVVLIEQRHRGESHGIQAPRYVEQTLVRATGSPIL